MRPSSRRIEVNSEILQAKLANHIPLFWGYVYLNKGSYGHLASHGWTVSNN